MQRLEGLDALRGIAALMVLALHTELIFGGSPETFARGYLAVDFFFMLSGFVMARTYERDERFKLPVISFFALRYRRLWPPMAVGTLLVAIFFIGPGAVVRQRYLGELSLPLIIVPMLAIVPNALTLSRHAGAFPANDAAWSIFAELVGNALHAAVLWRLSSRQLLLLAAVVLVAMQALSPGLDITHGSMLLKGTARMLVAYSVGIALCRIDFRPTWPAWPALAAFPGLIFALAFVPPWADPLFLFACPFMILAATNMAESRIASIAGALSFPLYAVHSPLLHIVKGLGGPPAFGVASSLAMATFVAIVVDRRLLRLLKSSRSSPVAVAKMH